MDYQKIGSFIAQKRKEKKLTQKELAKQLNVTDKAVSKWERGCGCPDFSILDSLSKALGVSILDILNGQDIIEEFIDTNNVKRSIENTINYSKDQNDKLKSSISKFLIGIILTLGLLIIILNLINIRKLNKKIYFDDSNYPTRTDILESIDKLNNNIYVIENNQGIYKTDEYSEILNSINSIKDSISNLKLFNYYKNKDYLKEIDLYFIGEDVLTYGPIMNFTKILLNYEENIEGLDKIYSDVFALRGYSYSIVYNPLQLYYYDINSNVLEIDMYFAPLPNYKLDSILISYMYTLDVYNYLIDYIIEVGEINE